MLMAYEYIFSEDNYDDPLRDDVCNELIPLISKYGYINDKWYNSQIEWQQEWNPDISSLVKEYGSYEAIPVEKYGSLEPGKECDIAALISENDRLIHLNSPHVFKDDNGYGHMLTLISNALGLGFKNISCEQKKAKTSIFTLSFQFNDKDYKTDLKKSDFKFPKPFLQLLYDAIEDSPDGEFVFFDRDDNPSYAFVEKELSNCLEKYGYIQQVKYKPKWK